MFVFVVVRVVAVVGVLCCNMFACVCLCLSLCWRLNFLAWFRLRCLFCLWLYFMCVWLLAWLCVVAVCA